jgi:acetolactate synthase-1/2/3 large subunit
MIVLNNSHLGMVRQWQDRFFGGRLSEVALDNPNFPILAAAYGIEGSRVDSRSDLSLALDRMLTSRGSYLLEVAVGKKDNVFPMMIPGAAVDEMVLE